MKLHANAALSWSGRRLLAERVLVEGWTLTAAAAAAGVSVRCARKWVGRYRAEGEQGLLDRSSAPRRVANRTAADRVAVIVSLRQLRMTAAEIAETLAMPLSTVSAILTPQRARPVGPARARAACPLRALRGRASSSTSTSRSSAASQGAPANASAAAASTTAAAHRPPADARKTSAGSTSMSPSTTTAGSPTPRCSPTRKRPQRPASSAAPSPSLPATASRSSGSSPTTAPPTSPTVHALACKALGIRHLRTRPRRPQTNGKAERFIRTLINGWAYGAIYRSSQERTAALDGWLWHYNHRRRHSALGHQPPVTRTNLLGSYI